MTGGTPVAGKVLTASDAAGNMTWQTPATGSGGVTKIVAGTNVTISPTTGVGNVTVNATVPTAVSGPVTGSVGGGCISGPAGLSGNQISTTVWGLAVANGLGSCSCGTGYATHLVFTTIVNSWSNNYSYICVRN